MPEIVIRANRDSALMPWDVVYIHRYDRGTMIDKVLAKVDDWTARALVGTTVTWLDGPREDVATDAAGPEAA